MLRTHRKFDGTHKEQQKPKKPCSSNFVQIDDGIGKKLLQKEEVNKNKLGF